MFNIKNNLLLLLFLPCIYLAGMRGRYDNSSHIKAETLNVSGLSTLSGGLNVGAATITTTPGTIGFHDNKIWITNKTTEKAIDRTSDVALSTITVANTITETELWHSSVPAGSLVAGNLNKFHADGIVTNHSSNASDEVTIRIRVGGITGDIIAWLSPDLKQLTGEPWHVDATAIQRDVGASGHRAYHVHLVIGDPHNGGDEVIEFGVAELDTTNLMDVFVTAQWEGAETDNTISLYQAFMEYKN